LVRAILLGVERYVCNLTEDLRGFHESITTSLERLHETEDTTYQEVKRVRREQEELQHTASEATAGYHKRMAQMEKTINSM
jgi:septation ring formation regulator EzrA